MISILFDTENASFGDSDYEVFQEIDNVLSYLKAVIQDQMETAQGEYRSINDLTTVIKDSNGNTIGNMKYTWES
jgi:hypothetical protein